MNRDRLRILLPVLSLAVLLAAVFYLQPRAMSYFGLNLLFNLAIPVALATIAQMMVIMVNDIDLSIGTFVSFCAVVTATFVHDNPVLGYSILGAAILAYAAMGAVIYARGLPAIVVTLGMSFVWAGFAVLILPSPGGASPEWLKSLMGWKSPLLAGLFGVLAGMALVGLTTAADANIALRYTLLSVAGVILGGGEFVGGRVSPIGAVIGALTLTLAASFLSFLRLSPDWQIGAQGAILILVLAVRLVFTRKEANA